MLFNIFSRSSRAQVNHQLLYRVFLGECQRFEIHLSYVRVSCLSQTLARTVSGVHGRSSHGPLPEPIVKNAHHLYTTSNVFSNIPQSLSLAWTLAAEQAGKLSN